jgi:alkylated DNA repair dioxygenase AlkB
MDFQPLDPARQAQHIFLEPGDVYVLIGDARYAYKHGIAYRDYDSLPDSDGHNRKVMRGTRLSVTFRRMKESSTLLDRPAG